MEENQKTQKKNTKVKTVWVVVAIIVLIVVAIAVSIPFYGKYEQIKEQELPEGYVTYNASRYFFRFDRPTEWLVTNDSHGFLLDSDLGLVCKMNPTIIGTKEGEDTILFDSIEVNFFYREIEDYNNTEVSYEDIALEFENLISLGKIFPKITGNVSFGVLNLNAVENTHNELCAVEFSTMIDEDYFRGVMYLAKRPKAYYCVLVSYEDASEFNLFRGEILNVVESFRMTVLAD